MLVEGKNKGTHSNMNIPQLGLKRLPHAQSLPLPSYETSGAAGMDIRSALGEGETVTLAPNGRKLIPTGFIFEIPQGFEIQVRPRSGLSYKHGVTLINAPGTIDSDFRGELHVSLVNLGDSAFVIEHGMRIAQLVVAPVVQPNLVEVDDVSETERGAGGFGSTGTS